MFDWLLQSVSIQLWQISVLFLVVLSVTFWIGKQRPHLAFFLWILFFVKCATPPVIQSPVGLFAWFSPSYDVSRPLDGASFPKVSSTGEAVASGEAQNIATSFGPMDVKGSSSGYLSSSFVLFTVWAIGSLILTVFFGWKYLAVRKEIFAGSLGSGKTICGSLNLAQSNVSSLLSDLSSRLDLPSKQIRILLTQSQVGPLVFGFWRPTIVIPLDLATGETDLRPVVAHELCHVWRRDHLLGWLQLIVQIVFWFHPFVWLASRQANRFCEICCDDDTVRNFGLDSNYYAHGLLDVLQSQRFLKTAWLAPGIRPVEITKRRIQQIVAPARSRGFRKSSLLVVFSLALFILPAVGSPNWTVGLWGQANRFPESQKDDDLSANRPRGAVESANPIGPVNHEQNRRQMDFLVGQWLVRDVAGSATGVSTFAFEESGKMLAEDWKATDNSSAQGVSYYDANLGHWKMTWVDSSGLIMESAGRWANDVLTLRGKATLVSGKTVKTKVELKKIGEDNVETTMWVLPKNDTPKVVSQSFYERR